MTFIDFAKRHNVSRVVDLFRGGKNTEEKPSQNGGRIKTVDKNEKIKVFQALQANKKRR